MNEDMPETRIANESSGITQKQMGEFRRIVRVMLGRPVVTGGIVIVLIMAATAILAPLISPYDPYQQNILAKLGTPSASHLLGTDELGRDLFSRIIFGARISLVVGLVAVTIAGVLGISLGLLAGYFGGWVDIVIMRFTDALLALPPLVLMLALAVVLGGGLTNVLISLGLSMMPTYCRLMYGQVVSLKETDYVMAARSMGARSSRIMLHHLLPNSIPPLLVLLTINLGVAIMMEASLSFLGIGIKPPTATWGGMVSSGYRFLLDNSLISFAPGCAIFLVVLAFNMVGDGLRDALDPRLRGIL